MPQNVNGLLGYGVAVPSLDEADTFYSDFGLVAHDPGTGSSLEFGCAGGGSRQVRMIEAPRKQIGYLSFGVDRGDLAVFQRRLEGGGVRIQEPPRALEAPGLWFRDPDGLWINLQESQPDPGPEVAARPMNVGGRVERVNVAAWQHMPDAASPHRLGHVLLYVSDLAASERFYSRHLGFRLSDRTGSILSFWHARPGDHHTFGFVQSTHPGLHHSSWEVADLDMLMIGKQRMDESGRPGWGLGRHGLGSNIFTYFPDPWGSWIEYFIDIDQIDENWEPGDYEAPTSMWSPQMPELFITNTETTERIEL